MEAPTGFSSAKEGVAFVDLPLDAVAEIHRRLLPSGQALFAFTSKLYYAKFFLYIKSIKLMALAAARGDDAHLLEYYSTIAPLPYEKELVPEALSYSSVAVLQPIEKKIGY